MIQPAHEEILPNDVVRRSDKFADIQVISRDPVLEDLAVGVGIILEEGNDLRAWSHSVGPIGSATVNGTGGAKQRRLASRYSVCWRRTGQDSSLGCNSRNHGNRGVAPRLAEPLVPAEEESFILLDRPS